MFVSKSRFINWTRCPMYFPMDLKHNPTGKDDVDAGHLLGRRMVGLERADGPPLRLQSHPEQRGGIIWIRYRQQGNKDVQSRRKRREADYTGRFPVRGVCSEIRVHPSG